MTLLHIDPQPSSKDLGDRIVALRDRLELFADLEPRAATDAAFGELVEVCAYRPGQDADGVLADPRVAASTARLRSLCADGEYRLERYWARRITAAADPDAELAAFPYLDNYRRLATLELHSLAGVGLDRGRLGRVCVLGSGPLPLTALMVAREVGVPVDAVDLSPEATALAAGVLERLGAGGRPERQGRDGRAGRVTAHLADARTFAGVAEAGVVVLAALVGMDRPAKREVVAAVAGRMRPGGLLVVRSAHRLRTLLYPPVDPADLTAGGLTPLTEVHPLDDVVNSLVVAVRS